MRLGILLTAASIAATSLFITSLAAAQEAPKGTGSTPDASDDDNTDPDSADEDANSKKAWSVNANMSVNRTILQEDVGVRQKAFNTFGVGGSYDITDNDSVRINGGFIQRFIADETETGVRIDDPSIGYSHRFKLPGKIQLGASIRDSIPISYYSQLDSLIALPGANLNLGRSFLSNTLSLGISTGANYYIYKYRASVQGDPNTQFSTNVGVNVSYTFPFHRALQISAGASTAWSWNYEVDHANDPTLAAQFGTTPVEPSADPYFAKALAQQSYSGQVQVSYDLPSLKGIGSNLALAVSQGDGVMRDGATHLYWLSRRGGQMSAALQVQY